MAAPATATATSQARLTFREIPRRVVIAMGATLTLFLISVIVFAAVMYFFVPRNPALARFGTGALGNLSDVLAPLIVIALFIERAVEVIVTAWRADGSKQLEQAYMREQHRAHAKEPGADEWGAYKQLTRYKSESQRLSFMVGTALALLICMMGVRALEMLLDRGSAFNGFPISQTMLFKWTDIFVTSALLAGGADGIHKIVSTFTEFMDNTRKKNSNAPTAPKAAVAADTTTVTATATVTTEQSAAEAAVQ